MLLFLLLSVLQLAIQVLLPLLATVLAKSDGAKWLCYWLLTLVESYTVVPFLGLIFDCEVLSIVSIGLAVAKIYVLNDEMAKLFHSSIKSAFNIVREFTKPYVAQVETLLGQPKTKAD